MLRCLSKSANSFANWRSDGHAPWRSSMTQNRAGMKCAALRKERNVKPIAMPLNRRPGQSSLLPIAGSARHAVSVVPTSRQRGIPFKPAIENSSNFVEIGIGEAMSPSLEKEGQNLRRTGVSTRRANCRHRSGAFSKKRLQVDSRFGLQRPIRDN